MVPKNTHDKSKGLVTSLKSHILHIIRARFHRCIDVRHLYAAFTPPPFHNTTDLDIYQFPLRSDLGMI